MPLLPNNPGGRACVSAAVAVLSLGMAGLSSGQVMNAKLPEPAKKIEGNASWYAVPSKSRTKQRAGNGELTAATNKFPLGSKVRVTHLGNKKSLVVRIIDRGEYKRGTVIDLSKEAAEQLDMLRNGSAHVQLEAVPDDKTPASKTKARPW